MTPDAVLSMVGGNPEPEPRSEDGAPGLDHLAECLHWLALRHGKDVSRQALVSGLPLLDGRLSAEGFVRAAQRLGFSARVDSRGLDTLDDLMLPAVLLLPERRACVLLAWESPDVALLLNPETGGEVRTSRARLESLYQGVAILVQPVPDLDDRLAAAYFDAQKEGHWFWRVLFAYRRLYLEVALCSLLINLFALASPLFVMNVYDRVVPNQAESTLWVLAAGIVTVYAFDFILRLVRAYFISLSGKRADAVLASRIFAQILNLKLQDKPGSSGSFANTVREFETVRDFFSSATLAVVLDLPFIFLFLAVIWWLAGPVAWVPLVAVPVVLLAGYFVQKPLDKLIKGHLDQSSRKHSFLVEAVTHLENLKSLGLQSWGQRRWEEGVVENARSGMATRFFASLGTFFTVWVSQMVTVVAVLVGFYEISAGNMTTGGLVAATILTGRALAPLGQVAGLLTRLQRSRQALANLDQLMRLPPERDPERGYLSRPVLRGEIALRDVTFSYPDQKQPALEKVSLCIPAGQKVGLLGRVGSGKSTIQKLILGLYQPQEGAVLLDGVDLEQLDPADARANMAYVPQNATLFTGSARENLMAAHPLAPTETLEEALDISGLKDMIARHPLGLDLPVGESGGRLSGGQRQLMALGRALMRRAPILLLDEPTASLDNTAERLFLQRLSCRLEGATLVLVTHKRALLSLVERLIILDQGRVVADGPRDQVLANLDGGRVQLAKGARDV